MKNPRAQQRLQLNTAKEIEELNLRLRLTQEDPLFKLGLLAMFQPNKSLRQLNNWRKTNYEDSKHAKAHNSLL
jgi:hypothetical protein